MDKSGVDHGDLLPSSGIRLVEHASANDRTTRVWFTRGDCVALDDLGHLLGVECALWLSYSVLSVAGGA